MEFTIRPMLAEDLPAVLQIFAEGIAGGNSTFDTEVPTPEKWSAKHFAVCRFVIEDGTGKIHGWAALQPVSSRQCFRGVAEVSIYLSSAVQGKGLGALLLSTLIEDSERQDFWTLQSGIFPENKASLHLHAKLGFRTVGVRERFGEMNGVWRDIVLLERRSLVCGVQSAVDQ